MTSGRVMVPVTDSVTLRNTVAYAVRRALETAEDSAAVHFVYPLSPRAVSAEDTEAAEELLDRVTVWAREDLGDDAEAVDVETAIVGTDQYLFSLGDYADVLVGYARDNNINEVLLDPEFNPVGTALLLPPLESELERAGIEASEAPVERQTRRPRLVRAGGVGRLLLIFGLSFGFYVLLAGSLVAFEVTTGAISAAIVTALLWRVSVTGSVRPRRLAARLVRMGAYAPYLLWEILKANVHVAYVVLHPRLPIDPQMVEFDAAVWSELPVTTLANSITLTPGTLTVDVTRQHFTVHALTVSSREGLLSGDLERAVRFVFYGRNAMNIPSPRERGHDGRAQGETEGTEGGEEA